ncbi:MAG: hypothetical protein EOM68_24685 [Spirochaetia bacterium]|nr:hypothetical protein [Spirochaetia bacterium]
MMKVIESSTRVEQEEQPVGKGTGRVQISPINRGRDRYSYDAIVGRSGMVKLMIGVDKVTGEVIAKHNEPDMLLVGS